MAKDYILEKRKFVIGGIAISIVLIYLIRLFVLQITTDEKLQGLSDVGIRIEKQ